MILLLLNHSAGTPALGMEYRPDSLAREWVCLGHRVGVVAADTSHVRTQQPQAGRATVDGIESVRMKTPTCRGNGFGRLRNILTYLCLIWAGASELAHG